MSIALVQGALKLSLKLAKDTARAPFVAVSAFAQTINSSREQGQVSLKKFTEIASGKRELLNIDEVAVSKELEKELKKHGVTWSVERHADGSQTFHIQGKDASLIEHSLATVAARVDEKLVAKYEQAITKPEQTQQQDQAQQQSAPAQIQNQRTAVPDTPAAQEHAAPKIERPERTARDRTRGAISERIDKEVKAKKAALSSRTPIPKQQHTMQVAAPKVSGR